MIQLTLKTVHGTQADDQNGYTQRDTNGRNHRNQRHHAATASSTAKTQTDQQR